MADSAPEKTVIAFDLFGTLLSTESVARELGELFGQQHAGPLAASWRRYQLEYSWRITCMGTSTQTRRVTASRISSTSME